MSLGVADELDFLRQQSSDIGKRLGNTLAGQAIQRPYQKDFEFPRMVKKLELWRTE